VEVGGGEAVMVGARIVAVDVGDGIGVVDEIQPPRSIAMNIQITCLLMRPPYHLTREALFENPTEFSISHGVVDNLSLFC
jgi:hypothetical protein